MHKFTAWSASGLLGLLLATAAVADDLEPLQSDCLPMIAKRFTEAAEKLPQRPIKIAKADLEKAMALYNPGYGVVMVVPKQGLKAEDINKVGQTNGTPIGYLFLLNFLPVVKDKAIDADKLDSITIGPQDEDRKVAILRLTVRKGRNKSLELCAFSKGSEPVIVSTLRPDEKESKLPVNVSAKDVQFGKATLIVNLFDKHSAEVKVVTAN